MKRDEYQWKWDLERYDLLTAHRNRMRSFLYAASILIVCSIVLLLFLFFSGCRTRHVPDDPRQWPIKPGPETKHYERYHTGKKISRIEIKESLKDYNIGKIYIGDPEYYMPRKIDIEWMLADTSLENFRYLLGKHDCTSYAPVLFAYVVQQRWVEVQRLGVTPVDWLPWAFGMIEFPGHRSCFAITSDAGVVIVEPQRDTVRPLTKSEKAWWVII